jgi:REP-associated tyrosine transposase
MKQKAFVFRTWGGKRRNAGRKPRGERAGVSHARRPRVLPTTPVHVTLKMARHVFNLRARRCFTVVERALYAGAERAGMRLVQFSVQGNHVHMVVEARDGCALARGIQGLSVRLAVGLNRVMQRRGRVFADRYHAHVLRTPTEVRRAVSYVRDNFRRHRGLATTSNEWVDPCSSEAKALLPEPSSWLLREARRQRAVAT